MKRIWVVLISLGIFGLLIIAIGSSVFLQKQAAAKKAASQKDTDQMTVTKGPITVDVVETGSLEPVKTVEVKGRVGGRVSQLLVEEGDMVKKGQLIAVIDPQETELQVKQNQAQLKGAQANVARQSIEIEQKRQQLQIQITKAQLRIKQIQQELKAQPTLTSSSIKSAQTAVSSAQKSYDLLVKVTQPNAKIQAQNAVADAQNNLDKAKLEEDRQKQLYELGYGTKRAWEQAELQRQLSETKLAQSKDALARLSNEQQLERDRAQEQINQAQADLAKAKANSVQDDIKLRDLESAKADLANAQAQLKDIPIMQESKINSQATVEQLQSVLGDSMRQLNETEIRAPLDGIVSEKLVQVGELVNALSTFSAGTTIVKIEDRSSMIVKLQINEIDVAKLNVGMTANIDVDAFPNDKFGGTVTKISPSQITAAAGASDPVVKYDVEVKLNDVSPKLKSGMSAKCTMRAIDLSDALQLPLDFVGLDEKGRFVEVPTGEKDKMGKPLTKRVPVTIGASNGTVVQILSGVKDGDTVRRPAYKGPSRKGMIQIGGGNDDEGDNSGDSKKG